MPRAKVSAISPFFIVSHVPSSLAFYRDRLGFEITFQGPAPDDIFFGIVRRGGAQILLKAVGGLFIARRLSEPSRQRGTYRFGHLVAVDPKSQSRVARQLPVVLADVCFGYLPKPASHR
jgi:catechol 2,3-dioxygenase-like lactoylglutathione lyase family enzyme